jgi:hypothetical protein
MRLLGSKPGVSKYDVVRRERFVHNLALGMNPVKAAEAAGFTGRLRSAVSRLMEDEWVQAELEQLRREMRERYRFDRDKAVAMLIDAYEQARLMSDPKAMVASVRELNEMHGHHAPQRVEVSRSGKAMLAHISDEELAQRAGVVIEHEGDPETVGS